MTPRLERSSFQLEGGGWVGWWRHSRVGDMIGPVGSGREGMGGRRGCVDVPCLAPV